MEVSKKISRQGIVNLCLFGLIALLFCVLFTVAQGSISVNEKADALSKENAALKNCIEMIIKDNNVNYTESGGEIRCVS